MRNIDFLPDKLNQYPTVFGGLTVIEVFTTIFFGALVGLVLGLVLVFITELWVLLPTAIALSSALALLLGSRVIARIKRGRPDNYLYRLLVYRLQPNRFIRYQGVWSIRRKRR